MNSLIIDTATKYLYVAVYGDKKKEIIHEGKNHSAVLMKYLDELLGDEKLNNIDEIIVGVGPGSYTGVRVGVVIAKMFSWTKNIPLKEISSLYLLSSGYDGIKSSMIDARRGNVFCGIYDDEKIIVEEKLRSLEEFMALKQGQLISDNEFKPDLAKIVKKATPVTNVHGLVPNYLRKTEAERNKEDGC